MIGLLDVDIFVGVLWRGLCTACEIEVKPSTERVAVGVAILRGLLYF